MRERIATRLFAKESPAEERLAGKTIVERIASGASGDVYLARDEALDRTVAIKILRGGDSDEAELRRLHREARTLARLAHPNVVHVYEVGVDDGRLYIAMEYVPGMSLSQWQRSARRPLGAIVRCYADAARGLAAAHAVGVIHRDVKPANILVGDDQRVRVVDFGLARTIEEDGDAFGGSPRSREPRAGSRSPWQLATESRYTCGGTPAYMAPETLGTGLAGPRSDQFSWAVSLHEALYDRRPYELRDRGLDDRPPPPIPPRTASGEPVPSWLRHALARALAWEPSARFGSMDKVVEALGAGPGRVVARRRTFAIAGAIALTAGTTWLVSAPPPACSDLGDPLVGVWDEDARRSMVDAFARTELDFAATTAAYATARLDTYADEWVSARSAACEATKIRGERSEEAYDLASACLAVRMDRLRDVADRLTHTDADTVVHIDGVLQILPPVEECGEISLLRDDGTLGRANDPEVVETRRLLAVAAFANQRADRGEALRTVELALDEARRIEAPGVVAEALLLRADVDRRGGDAQSARSALLAALDEAERSRHDALKPRIWLELARLSAELAEDGPSAREYVRRAEASLARVGREPSDDAEWHEVSGIAEAVSGELAEAETRLRRAVELRRTDGSDPLEVARALALLANWLPPERIAESIDLYQRAMRLRADTLGPGHPLVAAIEFNLGSLAYAEGDLVGAKQTFERVLATSSAALGRDAPRLATMHVALADLANTEGRHDDAIREASRAVELQDGTNAFEPSVKASAYRALANAYRAQDKEPEALSANLEALGLEEGRRPEVELAPARVNAGENLCALGRCAAARAHYQKVADALVDAKDDVSRKIYAYAMNGLGKVDLSVRAPAAALASFEVALSIAEQELPERDHALIGEVQLGIAQAFRALASESLAREHAEEAREEYLRGGLTVEAAKVEDFLADSSDRQARSPRHR